MKVFEYIKDPKKVIFYFGIHGHFRFLSDSQFVKMMYWTRFGKIPNLEDPKSYNEKLQWLKLHDRCPAYCTMVDKYEVKKYVSSLIGEAYIIPTLGVWDSPEEIDFDSLPNQFVLKCTHDSGGIVICKDKRKLDRKATVRKLQACLKKNYFWSGREWPYRDISPKILAEEYLVDESGNDLKDYKVLCFDGVPKLIELHAGRYTGHQTQDFYDTEWRKTEISQSGLSEYQSNNVVFPKPESLEKMLRLSEVLSSGLVHVRIDWYSVSGKLYFGEITFFDGSGFDPFDNLEDDLLLGSWINLPSV